MLTAWRQMTRARGRASVGMIAEDLIYPSLILVAACSPQPHPEVAA